MSFPLEERRIIPGKKFRISGLHKAQIGYKQISSQHFAQILVRGLSGDIHVDWEDFPDVFRRTLQKALAGEFSGDAAKLAQKIESAWKLQENQILEIEKIKQKLLSMPHAPDAHFVKRLVIFASKQQTEKVSTYAKRALEEIFSPPEDGDWEKFADSLDVPGRLTSRIGKFLGNLFQKPLSEPSEDFFDEEKIQSIDSGEFLQFFESMKESSETLTPLQARELFEDFLSQKKKQAARRITRRLEKEQANLMRSVLEKDRVISQLKEDKNRLEQILAEKNELVQEKDETIQHIKHKLANYRHYSHLETTTTKEAFQDNSVLQASKKYLAWHVELAVKVAHFLENEFSEDDCAQEILQETLAIDPNYAPARKKLAWLYQKHQKWQELIALYQEEMQNPLSQARQAEIYRALGHIYYRVHKWEHALNMYRKYLEIAGQDISVIKQIQDIYRTNHEYCELVWAYEQELSCPQIEEERRVLLALKIAEIQEQFLEDDEKARDRYEYALKLKPNDLIAIRGLQRIYTRSKEYELLQNILIQELELQKKTDRLISLQLQLAKLKEEHLEDREGAIKYYEKVRLVRPNELDIVRNLKILYKEQENWIEYSNLIEKEILLLNEKVQNIDLHIELVKVYSEHLQRWSQAILHAEVILKIDPEHRETIVCLQKLYEKTENLESLAKMYLKEAKLLQGSKDEELLAALYFQAGEIYYKLHRDENAMESLQKSLEVNIYNGKALSLLALLLEKLCKWRELIQIFQQAVQISEDQKERTLLHLRIGKLYENEFQEFKEAFVHYNIAHENDPKDIIPVRYMRILLEKEERWADVIYYLEKECELLSEKQKFTIYFQMGKLWKRSSPYFLKQCSVIKK